MSSCHGASRTHDRVSSRAARRLGGPNLSAIVIGALLTAASAAWGQPSSISPVPLYGPLATADCDGATLCETWMEFRRQHPAPYQSIAIKLEPGQDQATVILSEPPPTVSAAELETAVRTAFPGRIVALTPFRMRTGLDGWLGDLAFRVKLLPSAKMDVVSGKTLRLEPIPGDLAEGLWGLHTLLHGTTDAFWLDDIATASPNKSVADLKANSQYLLDKFADGTADWSALDDRAAKVTTRALKGSQAPAAYLRDDGLVVLALPQKLTLADTEVPFTRFAFASDLLLGAVRAPSGALLLIGRARAVPLSVLPPLRWETFRMLARNGDDELDQSYERRRIFAGKVRTGPYQSWDWAPILLSAQLDDSEMGTLLNQADQILKSWSQHGAVKYLSFNYEEPREYPFGTMSASDFFSKKQGSTSLIFNWNTNDFGLLVANDKLEVLVGDRTAALPILYMPGGSQKDPDGIGDDGGSDTAGETEAVRARDVFAAQGDAVLTRVAQNVLLGQALRTMLTMNEPAAPKRQARSDRTATVLDREAEAWLARVVQGSEKIDPEARAILLDAQNVSALPAARFASFVAVPQRLDAESLTLARRARALRTKAKAAYVAGMGAEDELNAKQLPLAKQSCAESGGAVTATKCVWQGTDAANATASKNFNARLVMRLAPFKAKVAVAEQQIEGAMSDLKTVAGQQQRLMALADRFERLSAIMGQASGDAALDRILPAVLAANDSTPSQGWIQTPSVVLSRNGEEVEAIGGHNARLTPSRARVRADGGLVFSEVNGTKLAKGAERVVGPPADPRPVMLGAGDGKLFNLLQTSSRQASITPDVVSRLVGKSEGCPACDLSYVYDSGRIYEVGLKPPPPTVAVLPGKTVMAGRISAAARERPPLTTQFVNFPRPVITDTQMMVDRLGGPPNGRFRSIEPSPALPDSPDGRVIAIADRKARMETLDVRGTGGEQVPLSAEAVRATDATVEAAGRPAVRVEFGDAAADADAVVVVTFRDDAGAGTRLAVAASGGADKAGLTVRLLAVVKTWLPSRPAAPLAQHLVDLRRTLIAKLDKREYLYVLRNATGAVTIVSADVASPLSA